MPIWKEPTLLNSTLWRNLVNETFHRPSTASNRCARSGKSFPRGKSACLWLRGHGTDQRGSDLDLLVDALPGVTLFDLGGLQMELEELLGVSVDLLTPGDLPLKFREQILAELTTQSHHETPPRP
jgi:hypothetical protein